MKHQIITSNIAKRFSNKFPIIEQIGVDYFEVKQEYDSFLISIRDRIESPVVMIRTNYIKEVFQKFETNPPEIISNLIDLAPYFQFNLSSLLTKNYKFYIHKEYTTESCWKQIIELYPFDREHSTSSKYHYIGIGFNFEQSQLKEYKHYFEEQDKVYKFRYDNNQNFINLSYEFGENLGSTVYQNVDTTDLILSSVTQPDIDSQYIIFRLIRRKHNF